MARYDPSELDPTSKERFAALTQRDPNSLSQEEKDFLFARRSYFSKPQREEYADLIREGDEKVAALQK